MAGGNLTLDATITTAGQTTADPSQLPTAQETVIPITNTSPLAFQVSAGGLRMVNSSGAFVTLSGIGASDTVTKCDFLYVRTVTPMQLRLTMDDPLGGSAIVSILNVEGPFMTKFRADGRLTLVEAKGIGQVEWLGVGQI